MAQFVEIAKVNASIASDKAGEDAREGREAESAIPSDLLDYLMRASSEVDHLTRSQLATVLAESYAEMYDKAYAATLRNLRHFGR